MLSTFNHSPVLLRFQIPKSALPLKNGHQNLSPKKGKMNAATDSHTISTKACFLGIFNEAKAQYLHRIYLYSTVLKIK